MMTFGMSRKSVQSGKMKPEPRKMRSSAGGPVTFNSITYGKNNNAKLERKRGKCLKLSVNDNFRRWKQASYGAIISTTTILETFFLASKERELQGSPRV